MPVNMFIAVNLRSHIAALVVTALCATAAGAAFAADAYPSRPIRLLVPYPPGGSPDLIARALATAVSDKLGQPLVVENRTGANGMLATEAVASSRGDGYTLLLGSDGPVVITPLLKAQSPTAPSLRLAPVTLVADSSFVLLASPGLPVTDLQSVIAHGRE